jgi:uncharacterized membrane protein YgcG
MRAAKLTFAFCALALLAGCTDYYDHDDRMTPYSGEAVAANRVAQMVDPWPAGSASPRFGTNGERMQKAIANYKNGTSTATASSSTSSSSGDGEQSGNGSSTSGGSSTKN